MQNEAVIKLIGHRPVYRVGKTPGSEGHGFGIEGLGTIPHRAPLFDQEQRNRLLSGVKEWEAPYARF